MRCSPGRGHPLVTLLILLAGAITCAASGPPGSSKLPPAAEALLRAGLADLHDGLYATAEEKFRAAAREAPGDPDPALFTAFASWWRIIQDRSDRTLDEPFLAAIAQTLEAGERALEAAPDDARVLTSVGTAHILRSQVEALRRNFFRSSQEARRGKKALEAALAIEPSSRDALFGLGAYNYYAVKIPGLARGLLFMPKGDAARGLEQLKAAAASEAYLSIDARLLLALVCGSRDEQCYEDAAAHLEAALAAVPRSPLLLGSLGGVRMRLGRYREAVRAFEAALAAAAGDGTERSQQRRLLKLYLAEALAADWALDRARQTLHDVGDPATLPPRERQVFERLAREISQRRGEPAGDPAAQTDGIRPRTAAAGRPAGGLPDRVMAALRAHEEGRDSAALVILGGAARDFPDDPLPRFLLGRLHFDAGRFAETIQEIRAARERAQDPPAWMAGWIELYAGLAEKALGRPAAAQAHFRAASEVRKFRSAERGLLELQGGEPPHGRCRP